MRPRLVDRRERCREVGLRVLLRHRRLDAAQIGGSCQPGGLGSREPLRPVALPRPDALDVELRIQPETTVRALRREQAVASLPGTQQLWADPGATAQLTDSKDSCLGHESTIQKLDSILTSLVVSR